MNPKSVPFLEIESLLERNKELLDALINMRRNVDVSTINNSKRATAVWSDLVTEADRVISKNLHP